MWRRKKIALPEKEPMAVPRVGYLEIKTIVSDRVEIRFSVPDHAWSELRASVEWKAFSILLERIQKESDQKLHSTVIYPQESQDYM